MPLADAVRTAAARTPGKLALVVENQTWSFADFDDTSGKIPFRLVGEAAQQDAAVLVGEQALRDDPFGGEPGVQ